MSYVDGFVLVVPKRKLAIYKKMATRAAMVWRDHGALDYRECVADDVQWGKSTSFPRSVKLKSNEVVVFSYIVHKSRKQRDRVNAKAMKDPRLASARRIVPLLPLSSPECMQPESPMPAAATSAIQYPCFMSLPLRLNLRREETANRIPGSCSVIARA